VDAPEKSFASAAETSKLLITLSTGVIAFCVTLLNADLTKHTALEPASLGQKVLLAGCWLILLLCTGSGIWVQLSLTHILSEADEGNPPNVWDIKIRFPYMLQIISFVAGMALLVAYGGWRLFR